MQPMYVVRTQPMTKHGHKGCKYRTQDIKDLCKAKDLGRGGLVKCMEEKPFECTSAVSHGNAYYCLCKPRVYIAKVLHKK